MDVKILKNKVLIKPEGKQVETTASGIMLSNEQENLQGTIAALGHEVNNDIPASIGDRIVYDPYPVEIRIESEEYHIIATTQIKFITPKTKQ